MAELDGVSKALDCALENASMTAKLNNTILVELKVCLSLCIIY